MSSSESISSSVHQDKVQHASPNKRKKLDTALLLLALGVSALATGFFATLTVSALLGTISLGASGAAAPAVVPTALTMLLFGSLCLGCGALTCYIFSKI